ncbi:MAG: hypothetical protein KatS3mg053_1802 [Candidatus Roseilinea sp.]|nr:MAG: hypothetical protein KatS3mg053_1802 [Candidatus Roseilinea sp.]
MAWRIKWNFPESLQFCAYVGEREGYRFDLAAPTITSPDAEWRVWLTRLLDSICRYESDDQTRSQDELRNAQLRQFLAYYDAPEFEQLSPLPELRSRCQQLWPDFREWWSMTGGEKQRLISLLHEQLARLSLNELIRQCMRSAHKSTVPDFALNVNLMRWPSYLYQPLSDHCFVAGTSFITHDHIDELRSLLQSHIVKLIGQR